MKHKFYNAMKYSVVCWVVFCHLLLCAM